MSELFNLRDHPGACVSCGYLGYGEVSPTSVVDASHEVPMNLRLKPTAAMTYPNAIYTQFDCSRRVWPIAFKINKRFAALKAEHPQPLPNDRDIMRKAAQEILLNERDCARWSLYKEGRDPITHLDTEQRHTFQFRTLVLSVLVFVVAISTLVVSLITLVR